MIGPKTTPEISRRLARVRQKGTRPEAVVGALLRVLGVSVRKNVRKLPGSPDFVDFTARWAIFVHGCFWHAHRGCARATTPKNNRLFWIEKFLANRARDSRVRSELRQMGFRVYVIWECATLRPRPLLRRLTRVTGLPNLVATRRRAGARGGERSP